MSRFDERRALVTAATLNIVLHLVGLVMALASLRQGSPLAPLQQRLAYLGGLPLGWSLGWAVWMLCALALVWFLATVRPHASEHAHAASAALSLAAAGAAIDLYCDTLQILVLPQLAAAGSASLPTFLAFERAAGAGGLIVANGLYSLAILLMALSLRRRLPPLALGIGVATFLAGMLMVTAGFTGDARQVQVGIGATFAAFLAWVASVTLGLLRRA